MSANERQVGGEHYQSQYQHWDFVQRALDGRYLEGAITKYVSRWRKKNGLQDLRKAEHYLQKLIEEYQAGRIAGNNPYRICALQMEARSFSAANHLEAYEAVIMELMALWQNLQSLNSANAALHELMAEALMDESGALRPKDFKEA
jgi:hypothetical protein